MKQADLIDKRTVTKKSIINQFPEWIPEPDGREAAMLHTALLYLSNPIYFGLFSIIVGMAYVAIWIISLYQITQNENPSFFRAVKDGVQARRKESERIKKYSEASVRISAATILREEIAAKRRARITRAVSRAA
jgi:hypothetical protein